MSPFKFAFLELPFALQCSGSGPHFSLNCLFPQWHKGDSSVTGSVKNGSRATSTSSQISFREMKG